MKVSLACGQRKPEGFIGVDIAEDCGADIVHDLNVFPWPFDDESVDEVECEHYLEHIPGPERPKFFNELYRILKPGATAYIVFPSGTGSRALQDFTHAWPPVVPQSFYYWSKLWREDQLLTHGPYAELTCDFAFTCMGIQDTDFQGRADPVIMFAEKHYINSILDYQVIMTKL